MAGRVIRLPLQPARVAIYMDSSRWQAKKLMPKDDITHESEDQDHKGKLTMLQWTDRDGDKLLIDVPSCMGETKSKS